MPGIVSAGLGQYLRPTHESGLNALFRCFPELIKLFGTQLRTEIESIKLRRKLQGPLSDDQIAHN